MARRSAIKQGIFTQTQFSALTSVMARCKHNLQTTRLTTIVMKKEECLPLFIKKEDHNVLMTAKSMITDDGAQYLHVNAKGTYTSSLLAAPITVPMKFGVRTSGLSFLVPDYANGRRTSPYEEPEELLPAHLQKYVDGRLSLAVEFGLLNSMLRWFGSAALTVQQMAYSFPPIIQMFSKEEALKKFADKHKPGAPSHVPSPPGAREMFSLVESTLMKTFMLENKSARDAEVALDAKFVNSNVTLMGWDISLS